jgi:hypothetical protein
VEIGRDVMTSHLHPVPRSGMLELYIHSPIRLHGVVLNSLRTGTNLPFLHFAIINMETWQNIEVTFDRLDSFGICTSGNYRERLNH